MKASFYKYSRYKRLVKGDSIEFYFINRARIEEIDIMVNVIVDIEKYANLGPYVERALVAGLDRAAERIMDELTDLTPIDKGDLRASFRVNVSNDGIKLSWGTDYARIVDGGSPPHIIEPKNKSVLKFDNVYAKSVRHPGQPPQNFTTIVGTKALQILKEETSNAFI